MIENWQYVESFPLLIKKQIVRCIHQIVNIILFGVLLRNILSLYLVSIIWIFDLNVVMITKSKHG